MNTKFLRGLFLSAFFSLLFTGLFAQNSVTQPDSVCVGGTEFYRVDSTLGSKYVWSIKGGAASGTILTPSTDSAAHIQVQWVSSLGFDTLIVVEYNQFGCNGVQNKLRVERYSTPTAALSSTNINICEGLTLNLSVTPTGLTPYSYQWKRDGADIPGAQSANLAITNVNATHSGTYTCVVTNPCGTTTSNSCLVTVQFNPAITLQPVPMKSTCPGANISLLVNATGTEPLVYQWKLNGVNVVNDAHISGATTNNLVITGMLYADTGFYTCTISNMCTEVTSNTSHVTINIPPVITVQPDSVSTCENLTALFSTTVTGDSLFYQWKKDGIDIPGAVSSTLSFNPVAYSDTANYVCVIHNTCGTVTTQNALLNINIPPTIVSQPDSVSTCVDLNTFFAVSVVGDSLYYQWKKEGMNLPGANQPTLVFTPATYSDTANYKCAIYNTCGSVETENVLLNMNIPPLILIQPDSVSICNGQNTSFVTGVFGDSLFYQWKKNGVNIPGATNSGLYFTPATYADTADYVCVITNTCGTETTINANLNMNIPPVIVNQPDSVSICDGQNTQFFVGVTGDSLFYQWKKNNVNILGATSPTLAFTPATYADTADYVCVITNTCGTVTTQNANLNMNIPPVIINQPDSVSTCPGLSVSFTTIVTGDSLNYQWLKNGVNMAGKTSNVLSFPSVAYADTANYVCHITNTCGEVYTVNANLNINIPPVIVSHPVTQSSCLGYSETFTVVATGDSLFYQWKRNGTDIPGATSSSYTVNPVSLANVGSYTCLVSNTCGSQLSNPAILTVNIAPVITVHPKKTSSCIGNSVTLSVVATGDSLFYQWKRNNVNIAGANASTYTINPVTNLNTGDYTCYVWNTCGNQLSNVATLSVNITPFITVHPKKTSSCIGNTVILNVVATGDSLKYQWRRNGVDVVGATSSSITISPVSLANVGNYTCFVYNTCGNQLSNVAALSVNQVPVITQQPVKLSSCVGYTAIFTVLTTGDSLFYQWRKNGVDMPGKTSNVLTIMPVTYADTATYTCYISNTCGFKLTNPAKLTVNRVPVVTVHPKTTSTCVGANITLNCAATGDSLFYQWRFNGVDIPGKTNPTLTINPVAYADTGFYSVRIYNTCGTAITNAGKVTVNKVPVITTQPKNISTCPGGNVTISTVVTGDSLFYQWRKNGFDIPGKTNSSITFNPVAYTDTADYRCFIQNTCGTALTQIGNLNINIPPVITSQPLPLLTCVGDPTFFSVGVTGDSLFYQWRFNGGNIAGGTNQVYPINPVTLANIGSYDVVIHNTCGTVTSNPADLFANIDPSVVVDPVSQSSCLGQTEVFTVGIVAAGSALPNFQWYKDGNPILGANTDTYTVSNINLAKTGAYYCELSNNCDIINTEIAFLTVNIAPVITTQPQNISTCIGNAESFVVVATGDSLFYQWYKDGFPVVGATTATLSFNPVTGSHIGFYYCHIWNTCGTVNTQPVQLYMNTPPAITLQPVNQKACAGDNVVLQTLATGDFLSYQWYKDGAILTGATSNVLQYNPVDYSARGQYYCRIQNNCGIINTTAVYIWVNTTPIITQQPQGMSTCAGENITLSVTALGDSIAYQWKLEGIDIPGATTNSYSISNIQFSQTGNYTCYMSTRCGNIMTEQAKVTINRVPNVTLEPTDVNACAGDLVVLDFGIFGDSLNFQWYKNGTALAGATTQALSFPAITIADRGLYKCHISNTCGEDWTLTINVWVNILPGVTQQPVAQTRCEDDTVSFHMTAIGDFITLQWYHDNTIIPGATSNSYSIAKIALADAGQYFCRVTSQTCGYFDSEIVTLTVVQKFVVGSVTENVSCFGAGDASIDLSLTGATPPVNYLWNTGATTEDLSSLQPGYYTVFIKDQNNCQERKTVEIMQPNVLDYVHDTTTIANALRMGGLGNDMITAIKTDLNGNTFVTGRFQATANFQTQTLTSFGDDDIFLAKYNTAGNLSWIKQAGGTLKDQGRDIALDSLGNIYIAGTFTQMAFFEATQVNANGNVDAFLAKYDNNGNLQWVKSFGGFFDDAANGVHADNEGYTWVTGSFQGISTFGTETVISAGGDDAFVSKFSPAGNIQWTKQAGGTSEDFANDVVVDISDDAIITGRFQGTAAFGTTNLVTSGNNDAFVAKYGPTGNLKWTRKAGGSGNDLGRSVSVDQSQNIYFAGSFEGNAMFGVNSLVSNGLKDAFVAKYDKDGNSQWVRGIGGSMVDNAKSIDVDALGNSFVAGTFRNSMQIGDKTMTAAGQNDMFMAKYSTTGYLVWSQQVGGTGADSAMSIALRHDKNLLVGGSFNNSVLFGATSLTSEGGDDAFMFRLNQIAVPTPPVVTQVNCYGGTEGSINVTIGGGTLPYAFNWSTGTVTEDQANIPVGTYWLFVNDFNDCAIDTSLVVTSQFQLPTPPTSASVNRDYFCTDDPGNITLASTGGSGDVLSWYSGSCGGTLVGNGASLSIASPTVTTTYYARWENVCDSSICAEVTVHVIDQPTAPASVSAVQNPICEGTEYITLSAIGGQGEVLKWYTTSCGGTEIGTGSPLTIAAPTVPTTYYASWETACGASPCASIDITVTPLPEPVTSVTATETSICYNATNVITLTATGGSGDQLKWTTGSCNGPVFDYGPSILIDPPTVTTTYYAYWENSCGTSPCESVTIEVQQQAVAPTAISVSNNFFCEGTVGQLSLTATGAQNGMVRWYEGFCGSPTYLGEGTTLILPTAPTATTTYYARTENSCPNPSECIWQTVTVYPTPVVFFQGLDPAYCVDATPVLLTGNQTTGTFSGHPAITNNGDGTAYFSPAVAGVGGPYSIKFSYTSPQGCYNEEIQQVTVNALPFVTFSGLAASYCVNATLAVLQSNQLSGTFTCSNPLAINDLGNGTANFDPALAGVGTHSVTFTFTDINGCSNSITKQVVVVALPVVDFAGLQTAYCVDHLPVLLTGNHSPYGLFGGMGITNIGLGQAMFVPAAAGVGGPYPITYTYTNASGCSNTATKNVTVNDLPVATFSGLELSYCLNSPQDTLTGNMVPLGQFSGPGITDNNNGTAYFNAATAGAGGPYSIVYTYTDGNGCSDSETQTTVVNTLPVVSFTGLNPMYCVSASPITLQGNKKPFGNFTTNAPVGALTDNLNGTASFDPSLAGAGTWTVTYSYSDNNGCSNSQTKSVTINPLPVVSFTGLENTYCINGAFDVLTGNQLPYGTFSGPGIENLNNGKARFHPDQAGIGPQHIITYTFIDNNACQGSFSDTTEVVDLPVIQILSLEPAYCIEAGVDTIIGSEAPMGTFSGPGIVDLNIGKALFNPATAGLGTHMIHYAYTDPNGCSKDTAYQVTVNPMPEVSFNTLATSYCVNANPVILVGSHKPFGAFTGTGVVDYGNGTGLFEPATAGVGGPYIIKYVYTDPNGCADSTQQSTSVTPLAVVPDSIVSNHNNFCTGTVPNITLSVVGGSGNTVRWFTGSCGGTEIGTGTSLQIPSPADTTKYFARWENTCNVTECDSIQINIIHYAIAPEAVIVDSNNFCSTVQDSIQLTAVGGFGQTFKWFSGACGTGTLVGTGTPLKIVAPLVTTTYYGRWETGCGPSACKDVLVTVRPQPIALDSVTSNHNDFCAGTVTNLVLKAYGGAGEQLEWYADSCGGAVLGLGNQITVPAPDTITTYYARWMNSCDTTVCESILINVFPQPVAPDSISADNNNYCSGTVGIVTLTAFGGSGDTLFWYQDACNEPSIGYSTTPSTLLINAPTETTTYFARYKNNCGESVCTSFTLNVIPQPMIPDTLTVDTNYFCQAYNGIIILNGFGGVGDTLQWFNGSCTGTYEGKGTELRIPAPDTTTWYFAKWKNPCGESLCDSILVVVNEPIAVDSVYANDTLFCFNDPGQLTLVAAGGYGDQINWYKNGCGTAVVGTGDTLVVNSPTITTTYFARWENYCGITECDSVKVTVIPEAIKPDSIEADTNFFCPGSVANITLTAIGGLGDTTSTLGDTLRWFLGSCGGTEIGTGTAITLPAPVVTTKYYARWENTCGVSECTEIEIVVDIPFPVTSVSVDTNNFCPGAVTDITLMSSGGYGTSLKWYKYENGAYVNLATGQPLNVFAPDTTTTYYVRWENVCGQSAWDSIVVVVNEPFAPPVLAADSNGYCSDYGLPLQLSGIGGNGDTLRWFTQSCGGIELGTGNPLTITAPTETTTLYARYENVCGVSECSSFILNVVPAPTLFAGTLDSVCEAGAYTIANTWAENHTSILWTTTGTGTFDDATSLTPVYTLGNDDVVDQDTVHLVMSVQGMSPCGIYSDTLTLLINPLPVIGFMPSDTAICRDSSLVVLTSGAMTYNWRPLNGINQVSDQIFVANPVQSTNYKVIGTSASGCVDSTDYNVEVHPTPVVNLGEDQYLFTCEPVVLNAGSGTGSERYEWQDGSVKQTFKVEENGTYWVKVSNDGCSVIDTVKVQICEGYIWMPTAFTPNNDGVNEVFIPRSSDLTIKFQMYIYSRNGLLIFQTDDISQGWDGRDLKGEMCNSGVYVWKVVYQGDGIKSPGVEKTQSGVVTLVR